MKFNKSYEIRINFRWYCLNLYKNNLYNSYIFLFYNYLLSSIPKDRRVTPKELEKSRPSTGVSGKKLVMVVDI